MTKRANGLYDQLKDSPTDNLLMFNLDQAVLLLFHLEKKLNFIIVELFTDIKVIIHMTIMALLKPRLQNSQKKAATQAESGVTSAGVLVGFFRKYKNLCNRVSKEVNSELVSICSVLDSNTLK